MPNAMDPTDRQITENLAAFEKEQDPAQLYGALDAIEKAERDVPAWDARARTREVLRWLRFFATLDRNSDPKWDPNDMHVLRVTLPSTHGVVYPSGEVEPATILDAVERSQYEQALRVNEDNRKRYDVQLQLRRIEEQAMCSVERLLAQRWPNSEAGGREFEGLLSSSPVNELRKERLRSLIPRFTAPE